MYNFDINKNKQIIQNEIIFMLTVNKIISYSKQNINKRDKKIVLES